jgi:hypothetical protein
MLYILEHRFLDKGNCSLTSLPNFSSFGEKGAVLALEEVNYTVAGNAGKKINGRKRHLLVDTLGLVLLVLVLPASIQDRDAAQQLLAAFFSHKTHRRVKQIWADGATPAPCWRARWPARETMSSTCSASPLQ